MAKYCTNCGRRRKDGENFCEKCGTAVGGRAAHAQAVKQGHWECQTFTESLAGARFRGIQMPFRGRVPCGKPGGIIANHIERIVDQLVACAARDGWEPDESLCADNLWGKQCVKWTSAQPVLADHGEVDLISVSVRFKRWVIP